MPTSFDKTHQPPSPAPTNPTDYHSDSSSEASTHTARPYQNSSRHTSTTFTHSQPNMTPHANETLFELSPTYTINAGLGKINVSEKLTDTNYISWALSIQRALQSAGLHAYLKNEVSMVNTKYYDDHRDCITNWLLNSMDTVNANQMQSCIMIPGDEDLELVYSPQNLWEETKRFHAPLTKADKFRIEAELDGFKQGYKTNLLTHIDLFNNIKDYLLLAGGKVTSEQLSRRLLHSLNSSHKDMIDSIIRNISPLTYENVKVKIRRLISENSAITTTNPSSSHIQSEANARSFRPHIKCTPSKCQGPHSAAECFSKPENFAARDKRMRELIAAGKWRGPIPASITTSTVPTPSPITYPQGNHASSSNITELTTAMQQMTTHEPHTTVLNSEFYCSNSAATAPTIAGDWGLNDTGASHHMFNTTEHFIPTSLTQNPNPPRRLTLADGSQSLEVHSIGVTQFSDSQSGRVEFCQSLYVPTLNKNLIAGGALVKKGVTRVVNPTNPHIFAMMCNGRRLFDGFFNGNLMVMKLIPLKVSHPSKSSICESSTATNSKDPLFLLHKRLGHVNKQYLRRMIVRGSVRGIEHVKAAGEISCLPCIKAKSQALPSSGTRPRASSFLENVHVDLSGIVRTHTADRTLYFILFTDDYYSMRFIYPLQSKCKESVFSVIQTFIAYSERQTDCHLKSFTLDCGSEFLNSLFVPFCEGVGIHLHPTAPYTPSRNGVSKRSNQTINGKAREMLIDANMPARFWYHAAATAVFLHNRTICKASGNLDITPYEIWHLRKPDVSHLRVFGCAAQILIRKPQRDRKFDEVTQDGVLLGFVDDNYNYQIYNLDTDKVVMSHNVYFDENVFPFRRHPVPSLIEEDTGHLQTVLHRRPNHARP